LAGFLHTKNDSLSDAVINQGYEILYGIGTITQIVSQRAEKVYGIELVEEAIEAGYKVERMRLVDMFPQYTTR